jgi:hypothetical protein
VGPANEGLPPWPVKQLLAAGGAQVTHGVDVTATFDTGVASLHAHAAYLTGLGDNPMAEPSEFLEAMARATGSRLGCRFGIGFEVFNV